MRFTECAGVASDETTLVTLPSGDDCCHKGGRLAFGKDGKLYVTLGDEHSVVEDTVGSTSSVPQDPNDVRGKILRYEPDGSIPSDNPFGAESPVWVAGLRNPFGIAFDTDGDAFVTSNGPTGDIGTPATGYDLAFRVEAGGRVPVARVLRLLTSRTGRDLVPRTSRNRSGAARSRPSCRPAQPGSTTTAPTRTPATSCSAARAACASSHRAHRTRRCATAREECHLDVKEGPDHALYFSDETKIYRLAAP